MKKTAFFIFVGIPCLLLMLVTAYLTFVFPDDRRVGELTAEISAPTTQVFVGSVLKSGLDHKLDMEDVIFKKRLPEIDTIAPTGVIINSRRFSSLYQVLAPVGRYPWRLEAWDGLAIPDGHTLTVSVPPGAEVTEFSVRDGSDGEVHAAAAGTAINVKTANWAEGTWYPEVLDRNVKKYLYLDRYMSMPRWLPARLVVSPEGSVTFRCKSVSKWCVISDPTFFRSAPERKPKQTIMVLVDTLRADALHPDVMPATVELAQSALSFERAVAPGNMTSPSTNGILACRPPTELGKIAFAYSIDRESRENFYGSQPKSFPAMLQSVGVRTAMIGNISVISEVFGAGVSHGFDQQLLTEPEGYETALAIAEAVRWVKENRSKDFFLYLHLNNPHAPYRSPLRYLFSQFRGLEDLRAYPQVIKWLYRGEAAYADYQIGKLLNFLEKEGLKSEVNVVVTSDHGDQHQERQFAGNEIAQDFTGVYFDHGATLLNDEIRVPLIIRKANPSRSVVKEIVSTLWIGKTVLGFFGLSSEEKAKCAGEDLANPALQKNLLIGSEGFQARSLIFGGRYKYIKTYEPTDKRVYSSEEYSGIRKSFLRQEQLYDLDQDPTESVDLTESMPILLEEARDLFRAYFGISASYELILEGPASSSFSIVSNKRDLVVDAQESDQLMMTPDGLEGHFDESLRLKIKYAEDMMLPQIRINDTEIPVRVTTLKLPWPGDGSTLPEETLDWMRATPGPSATIVLVRDDRRQDRRISLGNPAFEKVLREWGYLNEN